MPIADPEFLSYNHPNLRSGSGDLAGRKRDRGRGPSKGLLLEGTSSSFPDHALLSLPIRPLFLSTTGPLRLAGGFAEAPAWFTFSPQVSPMKDRSDNLGPHLRAWRRTPVFFDHFFSLVAGGVTGMRQFFARAIPLTDWDWTTKPRKKSLQPNFEKLESRQMPTTTAVFSSAAYSIVNA